MSENSTTLQIMIVDDDPVFRRGVRQLVDHLDNVSLSTEAKNGQEALEKAIEYAPDVVLLDYQMPKLDGATAARRILAVRPKTKLIGISAHLDKRSAAAMHDAGVIALFAKSDGPSKLLDLLKTLS